MISHQDALIAVRRASIRRSCCRRHRRHWRRPAAAPPPPLAALVVSSPTGPKYESWVELGVFMPKPSNRDRLVTQQTYSSCHMQPGTLSLA